MLVYRATGNTQRHLNSPPRDGKWDRKSAGGEQRTWRAQLQSDDTDSSWSLLVFSGICYLLTSRNEKSTRWGKEVVVGGGGVTESRVLVGDATVGARADLDGNNTWEELAEGLRAEGEPVGT